MGPRKRKTPKGVAFDRDLANKIHKEVVKKVGVAKEGENISFIMEDGQALKLKGDYHSDVWKDVSNKIKNKLQERETTANSFIRATNGIRMGRVSSEYSAFEIGEHPTNAQLATILRLSKGKKTMVDVVDPVSGDLLASFGMEPYRQETLVRSLDKVLGEGEESCAHQGKGGSG